MHGRQRAARRSCNYGRAKVDQGVNVDIVNERLQSEWERGCLWAGVALALTFGPLMGLGICWGWL